MYPYYQPFYIQQPFIQPNPAYQRIPQEYNLRQPIQGQVTWTEGGEVTKCNIPWSENDYMTAAVGESSPYQCGEFIRIRNIASPYGREIVVMIVDEVEGFPPNRINIHRKAFEALGVNPNVGILNVEIMPFSDSEMGRWGSHLLNVVRSAFPEYQVMEYRLVHKTKVSENGIKEKYMFMLQNTQERLEITGEIIYDPNTNRIRFIQMKEV